MTALVIGAALAVLALLYVLFPLFDSAEPKRSAPALRPAVPESAIDALREIEFDRETGKLSDDDYASLKTEYTRTALVEMRAREPVSAPSVAGPDAAGTRDAVDDSTGLDPAEVAVLKYRSVRRSCDECGPRPEPDPAFCSSCGKYLKGACAHCGATIDQPRSKFCANCGSSLAA